MRSVRPIPRGLPLSLIDELSLLFSEHFIRFIKNDECYLKLHRINWQRCPCDIGLPVVPSHVTPELVFRSEVQNASKPLLQHWENGLSVDPINHFLNTLYNTELFKRVYEILVTRKVCDHSISEFQEAFRLVWFGEYSWNQLEFCMYTTCGFKHVFIGEPQGDRLNGLHHWARYFLLERSSRTILHEIIKNHPSLHLAAMRFSVDSLLKQYGTIFFGVPIDFEMLLFFCVFLIGRSRGVVFYIDGNPVTVISHDVATSKNSLATAYFKY